MKKPTTKDEAIIVYRALIRRHGLQWTVESVPDVKHWNLLEAAMNFLTADDRRAIARELGLRK